MTDTNSVLLIGRLTRDCELKYTANGLAIGTFSLAVNRNVKKGDGWADEASFFDVSCFGKTAENLSKYLTKGKQIAVSGYLRQKRWKDTEGVNKNSVEINADNIQLLGGNDSKNDSNNARQGNQQGYGNKQGYGNQQRNQSGGYGRQQNNDGNYDLYSQGGNEYYDGEGEFPEQVPF